MMLRRTAALAMVLAVICGMAGAYAHLYGMEVAVIGLLLSLAGSLLLSCAYLLWNWRNLPPDRSLPRSLLDHEPADPLADWWDVPRPHRAHRAGRPDDQWP